MDAGETPNFAEPAAPDGSLEPAAALTIEATLAAKLSLADFQNAVPLLRDLTLVSTLRDDAGSLELSLMSTPAFVRPKTWRLESIRAGDRYRIRDLDVQLDGPLLTRLTEAENAAVTFSVRAVGGEGGRPVAELSCSVELLPRNQWGGLSHLPDMVAAFVQPNDPAVDRILKKTAELLREHGRDAALDGYRQAGAKRAWELAGAAWGAIVSMKLDYALPPASFEQRGQKVRGATQIADSGLGTCMDLTLLFCSTLEQIGLNPIIVFTRGHAFAGVWLKPEEFSTIVIDDVTALRKRLKLKELVLFETTLVTHRPGVTFSRAVEVGAEHIAEEKDDIEKAKAEPSVVQSSESPAVQASAAHSQPSQSPLASTAVLPEVEEVYARRVAEPESCEASDRRIYVECDPASVVENRDPDAFFDKSYDERLLAMVSYIVAQEGPILDLALARRISRAHGWQRTGSRIQERVEGVARKAFKTTEEDVGTFYWPTNLPPGTEVPFRPAGADTQRSMDEVCMEELVVLARAAVEPTATDDENLVAMARELGLARLRAASRGRLEEALKRFRRSQDDQAIS